MSIIIFIIILAALILVHEFGHFIVAKKSGIQVDEFGIGFPPKVFSKKYGETTYSVNLIPFGGFVKIFGENPNEEGVPYQVKDSRNFQKKSKIIQALVLAAGVIFNLIFAWLLISAGYMSGLPSPADNTGTVKNAALTVVGVIKDSPAEKAGLKVGDKIISISAPDGKKIDEPNVDQTFNFLSSNGGKQLDVIYKRGGQEKTLEVMPKEGVVSGKPAIGISMDMIGTLQLNPTSALWEGLKTTSNLTVATVKGLSLFLFNVVRGKSDFSQVAGPVGIVGMVGDVSSLGFIYLLSFTAFISINLAVINLIPFPALDGGRLLFVLIETVRGKSIRPRVANILNTIGFFLLIALMVVVTYHDVVKMFVR